jgi:predicted dehydrogenase
VAARTLAIAAAAAGKPMLIEEPMLIEKLMCFSVAGGRAMIEAARDARENPTAAAASRSRIEGRS